MRRLKCAIGMHAISVKKCPVTGASLKSCNYCDLGKHKHGMSFK